MRRAVLAFATLCLAPLCAYAVDGVVLINQATVTAAGGFPYVISQPGSYKLSGNLVVPYNPANSASTGILITASNVTLDLGGFTISSTGGVNSKVQVNGQGVAIANGAITGLPLEGGVSGLFFASGSAGRVDHVTFTTIFYGVQVAPTAAVAITNCTFTGSSGGPGVQWSGRGSVSNSLMVGNYWGIYVAGGSLSVMNNTILNSGAYAVAALEGAHVAVGLNFFDITSPASPYMFVGVTSLNNNVCGTTIC